MSEPRLISPMLDNFMMGGPISDHHGVYCCPAMEKGTDDRYIVKIISIPASQTQLDALLLTEAFSSTEAALDYFKSFALDHFTVDWNNEIGFDPMFLYERSVLIS